MPYECLWPVTLSRVVTVSVVVYWFELVVVINLDVVVVSLPDVSDQTQIGEKILSVPLWCLIEFAFPAVLCCYCLDHVRVGQVQSNMDRKRTKVDGLK